MECLDAHLGPNASWSAPDNPDFAEDTYVLGLDDFLLKSNGFDWHSPTINIRSYRPELQHHAMLFLKGMLERYPVFALKEPRMCRLLPFWRTVFELAECDVSVVEVVRHPAAVAASLLARNGIKRPEALNLWIDHVECALDNRDLNWPWVTVEYDTFLSDPRGQIQRIGKAIDLPVFSTPKIRHELRHHDPDDRPLPKAVAREWSKAKERANA
jgi:hypothetical protein